MLNDDAPLLRNSIFLAAGSKHRSPLTVGSAFFCPVAVAFMYSARLNFSMPLPFPFSPKTGSANPNCVNTTAIRTAFQIHFSTESPYAERRVVFSVFIFFLSVFWELATGGASCEEGGRVTIHWKSI